MPYGMYISAEGAAAQSRRMEVVSNNLANVNTVGFKRDVTTFRSRFAEAVEQNLAAPGDGGVEDIGGGVFVEETRTDYSPGTIKHTGRPSDLAIDGDGFFQVQKGDQAFLTKAGNFQFNSSGQLVNPEGLLVLSDSGQPVVVSPELGPWQITPDGSIRQGDTVTQLALVRPASQGDLVKVGENLFEPLADTLPVPPTERSVRSGHLEMSGVNPTTAMLELVETSRAFEANMKLIQNQDHMLGTLVNRLLKS